MSCVVTSTTDFNVSRVWSGDETSTAMITSAPICCATSIGRFIDTPPSTSKWPSISTGVNAAGIDMLARSEQRQIPRAEHHGPAGREIRRDGTERHREIVEVFTCDARKVSREITMSKTWP